VFTSLYSFERVKPDGKPDYDSAKITHLFFDLDNDNAEANMKKLHQYFSVLNIIHTVLFSGGGYHVYAAVKYPNFFKNKKATIFNAVTNICDKLGLTVGINEHSDIDAHTVGNIAQLVRVPGTFNIKRKKFASNMIGYGKIYCELEEFDREPEQRYRIPAVDFGDSIGIDNINVEKFPPCIKSLLTKKLIKHRERYIVITYCKDIGLPLKDTILLLKNHLEHRIFHHCCYEERQPIFIYRRGDLSFPSCETLRREGLCVENCKK
jgi:hypothetical protein